MDRTGEMKRDSGQAACLIACGQFDKEIAAALARPDLQGLETRIIQVDCNLGEAEWPGLGEMVGRLSREGFRPLVIGGHCLFREEKEYQGDGGVGIVRKGQCLEWLADELVLDRLQYSRELPVLPGWVNEWESFIERRFAGDRKKARAFFHDLGGRIVLLDTGVWPEAVDKVRAFAKFVQLPYQVFPVGLSLFSLNIYRALREMKPERPSGRQAQDEEAAGGSLVSLSRVGLFLDSLTLCEGEEEVILKTVETFKDVFSPRQVAFYPEQVLQGLKRQDRDYLNQAVSRDTEYVWNKEAGSLLLRLGTSRELKGVVEISGVRPEERNELVQDALVLAKTASHAFWVESIFKGLQEEREKARQAEEARDASERRLSMLFKDVPIGLYRSTPAGEVIDANLSLARMLGYPDVESLKKVRTPDLYFNPADRETSVSLLEANGFITDFMTQLKCRDGSLIWVRDNAKAVKDASGRVLYYEGIIEDFTKKKQVEAMYSRNVQVQYYQADVSKRLLNPISIDEMSRVVLEHCCRITSSETGLVGYIAVKTDKLVPAACTSDVEDLLAGHPERRADFHENSEFFRNIRKSRKPLLLQPPETQKVFKALPDWHFRISQLIVLPVIMEDSLVGLIMVANPSKIYSEDDVGALDRLAELYALAVYRSRTEAQLRELSLVDELTGLYNRRGFLTLAEQQIKIARRNKKEMLLFYADLDDLKAVNDGFGHLQGDQALCDAANLLRESFRESDITARIGGDEFAVLALDVPDSRPEALSRRFQKKVSAWNEAGKRRFQLSLSVGIVIYKPESAATLEEMIETADRLMYQDKTARKSARNEAP